MTVAAIKAVLKADIGGGGLVGIATGGIYDYNETGRLGLSRTTVPGAFDANGIIKPCVLLKRRSKTPDNQIVDEASQYMTAVDMIECWLYEDNGYTNIDAMAARIYLLLHNKQVTGTFQVMWAGDVEPIRDDDLDATVMRSDYMAQIKKSA